jgi:predicted dehydrogenase
MKQHGLHSRRSLLKLLGTSVAAAPFVTSNLMANSPAMRLRHASFGAGGMAWSDLAQIANCQNVDIVAICDVDLTRTQAAKRIFPKATIYQDWRILLEKEEKNLDSVNVSTPDHMHAAIGMSAMQLGKHVYGQKPLAHNLHEVRRMTELAKEKKLVTQMGIQVHSSAYYRIAVQLLKIDCIGKIQEIHSWCNKSWGDSAPTPNRIDPIPEKFNWDLWLGVRPERPFIGGGYHHPGNWRKRLDFGTGTLGDMGCHILDPIFGGIGLGPPVTLRSEGTQPNTTNWAVNGKVIYTFDGTDRTADESLIVTWYDGNMRLPTVVCARIEDKQLPDSGSIIIGSEGVMLLPHMERPYLFPSIKYKDFNFPKIKGINHWSQFVNACRGEGKTTADFNYAGPLTETILLGGIASHFPQSTLEWNSHEMRFKQSEANRMIRGTYREGWNIP